MKKILCAIPIPYEDRDSFWVRELGLLVIAFNEIGLESRLVVLKTDNTRDDERPVLQVTMEEMTSAAWWREQNADAIILNLWSAPRYDNIRLAVKEGSGLAIERLDTSGIRIPRIWPAYAYVQTYGGLLDAGKNPFAAMVVALVKHGLFYLFPGLMEEPMARSMHLMDAVVAESPLAAARIRRHMEWHIKEPVTIAQISNPVLAANNFYDPAVAKEDCLVSVARWDSYQKDFPLLLKAGIEFLKHHPEWSWDIIGKGTERFSGLLESVPDPVKRRIRIHGILPQSTIGSINRKAKIHYLASRWEGFCNASIEALCCGCSYVGPINIAGSSYLIEKESGTIASRRTCFDLVDALTAEASAWGAGRRNPHNIAAAWKAEAGYREVADKTLALLKNLKANSSGNP